MSDKEDDQEFLNDIEALQLVLDSGSTSTESRREKKCDLVTRHPNASSRGFGEVEPKEKKKIPQNESYNLDTAYAMNLELMKTLKATRSELSKLLERCLENQRIIDKKISMKSNSGRAHVRVSLAGMPYFKDKKQFSAPWNNDTRTKKNNGELRIVHLRTPCPWTENDRKILWKEIREEAASEILYQRNDDHSEESSSKNNQKRRRVEPPSLPKNFKDLVGSIGSREFNWLKISAKAFNKRHTDVECRVIWNVFLHPDLNKRQWTKDEDLQLERLNEKYKHQNWEAIAMDLNSGRSAYQCFIRFNATHTLDEFEEGNWSEEEKRRLKMYIDKLRIGNYIPWSIVSRYMKGRTKTQVYFHWMFNEVPHLKKGRFTEDEDKQLIEAVRKYGENFQKIASSIMINRSSAQLTNHYETLCSRLKGKKESWTIEEDSRLVCLYNKYGADWVKLAAQFPGRNRTQVRHRHKSITKYWEKNVSLLDIPRKYKKRYESIRKFVKEQKRMEDADSIEESGTSDMMEQNEDILAMTEIDRELLKYFQFAPPPSKPGRKRKFYNDEEVKSMTKQLLTILTALEAKLDIPDNLEDTPLTEKDKQILKSLKDYMTMDRRDTSHCQVQEREEMDGERHFTPACSGDCNPQRKWKVNDTIEYVTPEGLNNSQVKLNMNIETQEQIVKIIGEETNCEIERLSKILTTKSNSLLNKSIDSKRICERLLNKSTNLQRTSFDDIAIIEETNIEPKKQSKKSKWLNWSSSDGMIKFFDENISYVEPNYNTMLGWLHIWKNRSNVELVERRQTEMSREAIAAVALLKRRLLQLFKYPIGLSCVGPKI